MKGTTIQLLDKVQTGVNPFNEPIIEEQWVEVKGVLVGQPTTDDITNTLQLFGKRVEYVLGIPKGDTHNWVDTEIILPKPFDGRFRTIGNPMTGEEENIPLKWGQNVKVERYG